MNNMNKCKNCIWFDQCGQENACEDYTPVSEAEYDDMQAKEYNSDLSLRHDICTKLIEEQNS
jgi:hypothetical protein